MFVAGLGAAAVHAAGRPRLGDRARRDRVRRRRSSLASRSSTTGVMAVAALDDGARLRVLQPAPVQPLHRLPRHHRPQGPPQLPVVPGVLGIANGGVTGTGIGGSPSKLGLPAARAQRLHLRGHRRGARACRRRRRDRRVPVAHYSSASRSRSPRATGSARCSPAASSPGSPCRPSSTSAASAACCRSPG